MNYSVEQMHDLRRKNTCLENKLTALEIHLHDAKYNMEKQTLEYQEQLKLVQNAVTNYCDQEHDLVRVPFHPIFILVSFHYGSIPSQL